MKRKADETKKRVLISMWEYLHERGKKLADEQEPPMTFSAWVEKIVAEKWEERKKK